MYIFFQRPPQELLPRRAHGDGHEPGGGTQLLPQLLLRAGPGQEVGHPRPGGILLKNTFVGNGLLQFGLL